MGTLRHSLPIRKPWEALDAYLTPSVTDDYACAQVTPSDLTHPDHELGLLKA